MSSTPAPPVWIPTPEYLRETNLAWLLQHAQVDSWDALHAWSVRDRPAYWAAVLERLSIQFDTPPSALLDLSGGAEHPVWLPGARFNPVSSCFQAPPDAPALIQMGEDGTERRLTGRELADLAGRVASALRRRGFRSGERAAIAMPMTVEAVAIYLGIVWAGGVVIGIADSFRAPAIAARLALAPAAIVFTQDVVRRAGRELPLAAQIFEAKAPPAVVIPAAGEMRLELRAGDTAWAAFLATGGLPPPVAPRSPEDHLNILFSSGTTGEPKAIPWTQLTPLKCAADAHFHQDVRPGDILVWPTNLGWMMGPWLIFAALLNRATIALFDGAPTGRDFCRFVEKCGATMLGVVPSLVRAWRESSATAGCDWSRLRVFSSTGECSRAEDMRWLMEQGGGKPVIEYCGGTEIGGAYLTGTLAAPCEPGIFTTPTLGLDLVVLGADGQPAETGEVFLLPPSIGLSTTLLGRDHHAVYYAGIPPGPGGLPLRRHGDELQCLPGGRWRALGRADDTMNLGGIKVSSAEIERALAALPGVRETAAIGVSTDGPCRLVIYAVTGEAPPLPELTRLMQEAIRRDLNPLFKISEVIPVDSLPRTESNKVMRRILRDRCLARP